MRKILQRLGKENMKCQAEQINKLDKHVHIPHTATPHISPPHTRVDVLILIFELAGARLGA